MNYFNRVSLFTAISMSLVLPCIADDLKYQAAMATAVRDAAQHVLPSVVMIEIIGTVQSGGSQGEVEQDAPTSGVIVGLGDGDTSKAKYVIASSIVASKPAASILLVTGDGTRHTAVVVAKDQHRDLVLLRFESENDYPAVELPNNATLRIGQTTMAVGRYGGDAAPMVSTGILSAEDRLEGIALQTDARVSASLYGGPLIDLYGNVLAILIPAVAEGGAESATDWYDSGVAFAIPAAVIATKLDRLKNGEDIQKGVIGIVSKSKDPNDHGTEIAAVRTRSPAEAAGIKAGDSVKSVAGRPVQRHQEIRQVLGSFDAGEVVAIELDRDGKTVQVDVTLADKIPPLDPQRLGVIMDQAGDSAIVAALVPESPASNSLEVGDVITKIGEATIEGSQTLRRQLISAEPGKPLLLTLRRGDEQKQVSLTPQSIAGKAAFRVPEQWQTPKTKPWTISEIKLPESANQAFFVAQEADESEDQDLGLLVLLLGPGETQVEATAEAWKEAAREAGVVVCVIAPEDASKWQPKELDVVANFAAAVKKKARINPAAVAVATSGVITGSEATAADSMALAVSISQSKTFFGVAVSSETRPPAVRLRENEPSASLQLMLPVESREELPAWAGAIEAAGYPIVLGGHVDQSTLLNWIRLLQAI